MQELSYQEELVAWTKKMKRTDRFFLTKSEVIERAKSAEAEFKNYNEEEFYATYLMLMRQFVSVHEVDSVIQMARDFLEDDLSEINGSQKLCVYYYQIVMGEY